MTKTFISYSRERKAIVRALAKDIEALGHDVWFDQNVSAGQAWWDEILGAIRTCDLFVFALAPEALNSKACEREHKYAVDLRKPVLPVLVADGVSTRRLPRAVAAIHILDYREQNERATALSLAKAISSIPAPEAMPDPLPCPPELPISYLSSLAEQIQVEATLSFEKQSALVLELKNLLSERETADDARVLLEKLGRRRDLLAPIGKEIEGLLAGPATNHPERPGGNKFETLREATERPRLRSFQRPEAENSSAPNRRKFEWRQRVVPSLAGAAAGLFLGALIFSLSRSLNQGAALESMLAIGGLCGALSGAISGIDRKRMLAAMIGAVLGGSVLFWLGTNLVYAAIGALFGLVAGSIAGVDWKVSMVAIVGFFFVSVLWYSFIEDLEVSVTAGWTLGAILGATTGAIFRILKRRSV